MEAAAPIVESVTPAHQGLVHQMFVPMAPYGYTSASEAYMHAASAQWFPTYSGYEAAVWPCHAQVSTASQAPMPQHLVHVKLQSLPQALCTRQCLEAAIDQAGLASYVHDMLTGVQKGEAEIILTSEAGAQRCIRHFHGLRWARHSQPVIARYTRAKKEDAQATQTKSDSESRTNVQLQEPVGESTKAVSLCGKGEEAKFEGKAHFLDGITSVTAAIKLLEENSTLYPEGYCVVYSERKGHYFLVYRKDKQLDALQRFNLQSEASVKPLVAKQTVNIEFKAVELASSGGVEARVKKNELASYDGVETEVVVAPKHTPTTYAAYAAQLSDAREVAPSKPLSSEAPTSVVTGVKTSPGKQLWPDLKMRAGPARNTKRWADYEDFDDDDVSTFAGSTDVASSVGESVRCRVGGAIEE